MKQVKSQHMSTTDPVRMAMSYAQESVSPMRLARALRRVYEDSQNPANPNFVDKSSPAEAKRTQQLADLGMADLGMRRASFIVIFVFDTVVQGSIGRYNGGRGGGHGRLVDHRCRRGPFGYPFVVVLQGRHRGQ